MTAEKKAVHSVQEPLLAINEFELEAGSLIDSAKREASGILEQAKVEAGQVIEKGKRDALSLGKEHLERLEEELRKEKESAVLNGKGELDRIADIGDEKIKQAVRCILDRLIPEEAQA